MNEPRGAGADLSPAERVSGERGAATLMDGWGCLQLFEQNLSSLWRRQRTRDSTRVYLGGEGKERKMASSQEVSTSF